MSNNTSTQRGYLTPLGLQVEEDADLDLLLQPVIVGITTLDPTLVRRKWQENLGDQPDRTVNWCAFGVVETQADVNPTLTHDGSDLNGLGSTTQCRSEQLEVIASFYGPASRSYASVLRDGLGISQNRDALRANGIAFVSVERMTLVGDFRNTSFIRRVDLVFRLRRMVSRTYAIENILSVDGRVIADQGSVSGL